MDLLGKKGEEAVERISRLESSVEDINSHLKAVDSALQDFTDNYQQIIFEELEFQKKELKEIENVAGTLPGIEERVDRVEEKTEENSEKIEDIEVEEVLMDILEEIKKSREMMGDFRQRMDGFEKKVDDLESEFLVEINNRDFDFEKKLNKREFESKEKELTEDIKKLRASVIALADELDKRDEIKVD